MEPTLEQRALKAISDLDRIGALAFIACESGPETKPQVVAKFRHIQDAQEYHRALVECGSIARLIESDCVSDLLASEEAKAEWPSTNYETFQEELIKDQTPRYRAAAEKMGRQFRSHDQFTADAIRWLSERWKDLHIEFHEHEGWLCKRGVGWYCDGSLHSALLLAVEDTKLKRVSG